MYWTTSYNFMASLNLYMYLYMYIYMYEHALHVHVDYTCLHGDREVGLGLWREVDIHSFLGEGLVALGWGPNLDDVKLSVEGKEKNIQSPKCLLHVAL